jgi:hypothetical protein
MSVKKAFMSTSQQEINHLNHLINKELQKNSALVSELEMFKDIVKKKDFDFMNLSDQEKLNAKVTKDFL